jgi:4-aminobutyrate aminotransferase-like enzyme
VAAAHAVLDVIDSEGLEARAVVLGDRLKAVLEQLRPEVAQIAEVRGPGSMVAVEFLDLATGQPDAAFTKRVQAEALSRGLMLLVCGVYGNVVRFLHPLTIEDGVFEEGLRIVREALLAARA